MIVAYTYFIGIFGLLFYVTNTADCRNADPELKKTMPDNEQIVGETCFASVPFICNPNYEYRELNGGCTCLEVPSRGMAGSALTRLLQADYQDNKKVIKLQTNGEEFKSARVLSNVFCTDLKEGDPDNLDKVFTLSMMQWAQCLAHDVVGTGGKTGESCCTKNGQRKQNTPDNCLAIKVPTDDRFYSKFNKTCISLSRTKSTEDVQCPVSPILGLNMVTSYIDGSLLYGSTSEANKLIRKGEKGLMKSQEINGGEFPPNVEEPNKSCKIDTDQDLCIQAGDVRANAHPMLAVMHAVLLRLHNKVAKELAKLNPQWVHDEKLFEETRRFVIACIQLITFNDYLPNLIGKSFLEKIKCGLVKKTGYHDVYDASVNPQILTEFAGSAFRVLHSTIVDKVVLYDENRNPTKQWTFSDFYFGVGFIAKDENFEQLIIGMTKDPQSKLDRHFATSITDLLFQVDGVGADLESLDIEKGRDLGCKKYPDYLEMIGRPYPQSFDDYSQYISKPMVERLKRMYASHKDVELFLGGMLEEDALDSQVGPTFQAIIAEQFCRLQLGDRFYFEGKNQPRPFTEDQLTQIRKVTLSFLYCYTCPKLKNLQPDAFRLYSDTNQLQPCEKLIGDFTLEPWREK